VLSVPARDTGQPLCACRGPRHSYVPCKKRARRKVAIAGVSERPKLLLSVRPKSGARLRIYLQSVVIEAPDPSAQRRTSRSPQVARCRVSTHGRSGTYSVDVDGGSLRHPRTKIDG